MNRPIPTTDADAPFTPLSLMPERVAEPGETLPEVPVFNVKPATELDYERLGYELFRHNIAPPTQDAFRSTVIDEIFERFGEAEGEEKAGMLDAYWTAEDAYQGQMEEWQVQERQRLFDQKNGAPAQPPYPMPTRTMGVRERNKALLIAEDMRRHSMKIRDLVVDMQTYEPRQRAGIARLVITGWSGLKTPFATEHGIIPEATWDALRLEIGKQATNELTDYAAGLGGLSTEDVGNSESQSGTEQTEQPSREPNGEAEASDGGSISGAENGRSTSSSEPIPASASTTGTDAPSNSSSLSDGMSNSTGDTRPESMSAPLAG